MLFLGTESYPKEGEYAQFLSEHGGSDNAYTSDEETVYYFNINTSHIKDGLERFSCFFKNPLFEEDSVEREINVK